MVVLVHPRDSSRPAALTGSEIADPRHHVAADARERPQRERVVAHDVAHDQGIAGIKLPHSDAGRNGSAMLQPADPGRNLID